MREVERITARMQLALRSGNATIEIPWGASDDELQDLQDALAIMRRTVSRVRNGRAKDCDAAEAGNLPLPQQEKTP